MDSIQLKFLNYASLAGAFLFPAFAIGQNVGPAPIGDTKVVALQAIHEAKHACPKIISAKRWSNGSITAICSNGEDYRIFTINGELLAMKCSAARAIGVNSC